MTDSPVISHTQLQTNGCVFTIIATDVLVHNTRTSVAIVLTLFYCSGRFSSKRHTNDSNIRQSSCPTDWTMTFASGESSRFPDLGTDHRDRFVGQSSLGTLGITGNGSLYTLQWRNYEHDVVSSHRRLDCLLSCLFKRRWKKTLNICVTGLYEGISPTNGEFPAYRASNVENASIWWSHHECRATYAHTFLCLFATDFTIKLFSIPSMIIH